MTNAIDRSALVAAAERSISVGSKSFRAASRLFDKRTRERAWLLYSWCRHCDDQCDGQTLGHGIGGAPMGRVADIERLTAMSLANEPTGELPFEALRQVLGECAIPKNLVLDHLRGFALDAEDWRPQNEADLLRYCYYVAGAVGCMMAVVMGVRPDDEETLRRASDLGIAFQLSNIARDVREDHDAGRCYLPVDWLDQHGVDQGNLMRPEQRQRLVSVVARLVDLAQHYEASAARGFPKLRFRSRWAVIAATGIYGRIGRRVGQLGGAAWDRRVVVPRGEKLGVMLTSLTRAASA
jgi:phytoene synthase